LSLPMAARKSSVVTISTVAAPEQHLALAVL